MLQWVREGNEDAIQCLYCVKEEPWNILRLAHWRVPGSPSQVPRSQKNLKLLSFDFGGFESFRTSVHADRSVSSSEYDSCSEELK